MTPPGRVPAHATGGAAPAAGGADDVVALVLGGARRAWSPREVAVRAGRQRLRHDRLAARVAALAARLRAEGLEPGDAVLFSVRPGPEAVVVALAVVAVGGIVVVADPGAGEGVFAARAELVGARWAAAASLLYTASGPAGWQRPLRTWVARRGLLLPDYGRLPVRHLRSGPWLPGLPTGAASLTAWSRPGRGACPPLPEPTAVGGLDAPALVVFTSGTTGEPRAVVHSRATLGRALRIARTAFGFGRDDVVVTDQLMIGLTAVSAGAAWSLPSIGAAPGALARRIVADGATVAWSTPHGWDGVVRALGGRLPESVRLVLTGSAPVPAPLLARLAAAAPCARVLGVYGATELLPAALVAAPEKGAFDGPGDLVGRPLPGVVPRIDPVSGELHLDAPHRCLGYLTPDGVAPLAELATGDAARLDPAGRIVLTGRLKDMIIRGSMNVYPGLYEPGVLAVDGVGACALVGLPDPVTADERIVLAVEPAPGRDPSAVLAAVRAALPAAFDAAALPDEVVTLELPRSGRAGKVDRPALRAWLAAR